MTVQIVALLLADFQKEVDTTTSRASRASSGRVPGHEWVPKLDGNKNKLNSNLTIGIKTIRTNYVPAKYRLVKIALMRRQDRGSAS